MPQGGLTVLVHNFCPAARRLCILLQSNRATLLQIVGGTENGYKVQFLLALPSAADIL